MGRGPAIHEHRVPCKGEARGDRRRRGRGGERGTRRGELMLRMTLWSYTTLTDVAHPAGINTGVEHSKFSAITSGRAVDAAMAVLDLAASPPTPFGRWIERWAGERAPYQVGIQQLQHQRDSEPYPLSGLGAVGKPQPERHVVAKLPTEHSSAGTLALGSAGKAHGRRR